MTDQRKQTRCETESLLMVFDRTTERHIGGLANLTYDGAMVITQEPIELTRVIPCRVELPDRILDRDNLIFDAECIWCRKDEARGWYMSGYALSNISELDRDILTYLMLKVMSKQPKLQRV